MAKSDQYTPKGTVDDETINTTTEDTSVETVIPETTETSEPAITTETTVVESAPVVMQTTQQEPTTPEKPVEVIPAKRIIVTGKPPVNSAGKSVF